MTINLDEKSFPYWVLSDPEWEYLGFFGYKNHLRTQRFYDLYYRNSVVGKHLLVKYGPDNQDQHMTAIPTKYKFADPFPPMAEAYKLYKKKYGE